MDYEKLYKEALERARMINNGEDVDTEAGTTTCEYIFPELRESEDEKTRKEIVKVFKSLGDGKIPSPINYADIFAWLEKQEQKSAWSEEDERMFNGAIGFVWDTADYYTYEDKQEIENWLKSIKQRLGGISYDTRR